MSDRFFVIDYETTGVGADDVPIEIGLVVCDSHWNELQTYEALIHSDYAESLTPEQWGGAFQFHKISQAVVRRAGFSPQYVADSLAHLARQWKPDNGRVILLSDNIQFEWRHTSWLLHHIGLTVPDCFHYCGWDTSVLSLFTSFRDPDNTLHRGLSDARGLVAELRRVRDESQPARQQSCLATSAQHTASSVHLPCSMTSCPPRTHWCSRSPLRGNPRGAKAKGLIYERRLEPRLRADAGSEHIRWPGSKR